MNVIRAALLAGSLLLSGTATAQLSWTIPGSEGHRPRVEELILPPRGVMRLSLDVLVDGNPVRLISHQGRLYLPVPRLGAEYEVRVNNHGPRRITAIVSVDGLSAINGRPASELHPGYLVDPYSHIAIKGWRRDSDTVAAFTFEERERSYAARMGHPENIGVIGLVAFEEFDPRPWPFLELRDSGSKSKSARAEAGGTGTGWGRDIDSRVYKVPFVRSTNRREITIHYDTVDALRRAGVPVDGRHPRPFPSDGEYSPPPPSLRVP
jgi:hypothetical protein